MDVGAGRALHLPVRSLSHVATSNKSPFSAFRYDCVFNWHVWTGS